MQQRNLFGHKPEPDPQSYASTALLNVCRRHCAITSDDVWDDMLVRGINAYAVHPNSVGAAFRAAVRAKLIKSTAVYVPSRRPQARGRMVRIWASCLAKGRVQ